MIWNASKTRTVGGGGGKTAIFPAFFAILPPQIQLGKVGVQLRSTQIGRSNRHRLAPITSCRILAIHFTQ